MLPLKLVLAVSLGLGRGRRYFAYTNVYLKGPYHSSVKLFIEFLELTPRLVKCSHSSLKSPRVL